MSYALSRPGCAAPLVVIVNGMLAATKTNFAQPWHSHALLSMLWIGQPRKWGLPIKFALWFWMSGTRNAAFSSNVGNGNTLSVATAASIASQVWTSLALGAGMQALTVVKPVLVLPELTLWLDRETFGKKKRERKVHACVCHLPLFFFFPDGVRACETQLFFSFGASLHKALHKFVWHHVMVKRDVVFFLCHCYYGISVGRINFHVAKKNWLFLLIFFTWHRCYGVVYLLLLDSFCALMGKENVIYFHECPIFAPFINSSVACMC